MGLIDTIVDGIQRGINAGSKDELPEWAQNMELTDAERNDVLAQEHNYQFQSQEAEKARQWQESFYKEYQSPSAMVQQYKDAGLNPMAIAGKVGGNTPPSASAPSGGNSFRSKPVEGLDNSLMSIVHAVLGIQQQALGVKQLEADVQYKKDELQTRKDIAQMQIDAQSLSQDKSLGLDKYKFDKQYELDLKKFVTSDALTHKQIQMLDSQIKNLDIDALTKEIDRQLKDKDNKLREIDLNRALRQAGVTDEFFDVLGYDPTFSWSYATQALLDAAVATAEAVGKTQTTTKTVKEWTKDDTYELQRAFEGLLDTKRLQNM